MGCQPGGNTLVDIVQLSADSKVFVRTPFRGLLGACLCFQNPAEFAKFYDSFFEQFIEQRGIPRDKAVYSANDIAKIFGGDRKGFLGFLESFVTKVGTDSGVILNLVWTTLSIKKLAGGVKYYGTERSAERKIPPNKFLEDLSQYYPYICAWLVAKIGDMQRKAILVDDLQGEVTVAWNELFANHIVWIMPNGDQCDPTISAADLCVRYFNDKLFYIRGRLSEEDLKGVCDSLRINARIHYVGHPEIQYIVPIEKRKIPHNICYRHPMIFILKEELMDSEVEYIRRSRTVLAIERYANKIGTGFKFIDYSKDYQYLRDGDVLIYLGSRGKEQADFLKNSLGFRIADLSIADVLKSLEN